MAAPEQHKPGDKPQESLPILSLSWQDYLLPVLMFIAFLVVAAVITVSGAAPSYGGYLAILFVGMTYPLPWNRVALLAAALASLVLFYWYGDSWLGRGDALAGLIISEIAVWAVALAVTRMQRLEGEVETQDRQLELALDASDFGIFRWDIKTNRIYDHGKLRELWGIHDEGTLHSRDIFRCVLEDDLAEVRDAFARALKGEEDFQAEYRVRDEQTGKIRWLMGRGRLLQTVRGRRLYMTGTNVDITGLKEEELRIRSIIEGLGVLAGLLSPDGKVLEANTAALELAKLDPEDVIGKPFWEAYWWSHDRIEQARLEQAVHRAAAGETVKYDAVVRRADDLYADIAFFLSPVFNTMGEVVYLVPSAIDITERKQAEEQVNLLVQELNHRIKNLFSVTNALINLSARHATDIDSFVQSTLRRLQALHASHSMTGADVTNPRSYFTRVDAGALAEKVLAPFRTGGEGGEADRIVIDGGGQKLDAGEATAFSLILNELVANSITHGSLSVEGGSLAVEWRPEEAGPNGKSRGYTFLWKEKNGPPVGDLAKRGFGHSIISLLTHNYIGGECSFGADEDGFRFEIETIDEEDGEGDSEQGGDDAMPPPSRPSGTHTPLQGDGGETR